MCGKSWPLPTAGCTPNAEGGGAGWVPHYVVVLLEVAAGWVSGCQPCWAVENPWAKSHPWAVSNAKLWDGLDRPVRPSRLWREACSETGIWLSQQDSASIRASSLADWTMAFAHGDTCRDGHWRRLNTLFFGARGTTSVVSRSTGVKAMMPWSEHTDYLLYNNACPLPGCVMPSGFGQWAHPLSVIYWTLYTMSALPLRPGGATCRRIWNGAKVWLVTVSLSTTLTPSPCKVLGDAAQKDGYALHVLPCVLASYRKPQLPMSVNGIGNVSRCYINMEPD